MLFLSRSPKSISLPGGNIYIYTVVCAEKGYNLLDHTEGVGGTGDSAEHDVLANRQHIPRQGSRLAFGKARGISDRMDYIPAFTFGLAFAFALALASPTCPPLCHLLH